jgi:VWFA-related protein
MKAAMTLKSTNVRISRILLTMLLAMATVSGQAQQQVPPTRNPQATFQATTDHIRSHVVVKDSKGQFVPDLRPDEFQVLEDGVPQRITTFWRAFGGRMLSQLAETPVARTEGLILPPAAPPKDVSGRIFIVFIDDMHLQALDSIKTRKLLELIRDTVLHENDLVGIVSTGYSSIAVDLNYDYEHRRMNEAIKKVMGSALTPSEIINGAQMSDGPAGLRYNANVAFSTAYDILGQAAKVTDRRKAFLYVSSGYDFNPFKDSRYKAEQERYAVPTENPNGEPSNQRGEVSPFDNPFEKGGLQFAETDLIAQIAELTRTARRSNVTFYTIDPRGLIAGPDINLDLGAREWQDYLNNTISSLKVLAEETGGICICNTNDFRRGLQTIDNEMSDYYLIGWTTSNPDPLKIRRKIEIKVTRPGLSVPIYLPSYEIRRPNKSK